MKKLLAGLSLCGFALVCVAPTAFAQETSTTLTADLNGANEVGEPGDPNGTGSATVSVDVENTEICFQLSFSEIDAPSAGHIHLGGAGSNGDVEVNFGDISSGQGCVSTSTATAAAIVANPQLYYVNLHNETFPAGAIRGQLTAVPSADAAAESTDAAAAPVAEATGGAATTELALTGSTVTSVAGMIGAGAIAAGASLLIGVRRSERS